MRLFLQHAAIALAVTGVVVTSPARADDPTGSWLTQAGEAQIKIAKCGKALCGTVAWLRDPLDPKTGQPLVDSNNPDPAKRNRKILGLRIFAMEPDGNGAYTGEIYNSDDGKTYRGRLVPQGDEALEVQGCSASNLCGFELWTRIKTDTAPPPAPAPLAPSAPGQNKK